MNELNEKILDWANEKRILAKSTPKKQIVKTLEELLETAMAVGRGDIEEIKDGIGDVYVTLVIHAALTGTSIYLHYPLQDYSEKQIFEQLAKCIIDIHHDEMRGDYGIAIELLSQLAKHHGLTLRECVEHSYGVISQRTGSMIDGTFVKDK